MLNPLEVEMDAFAEELLKILDPHLPSPNQVKSSGFAYIYVKTEAWAALDEKEINACLDLLLDLGGVRGVEYDEEGGIHRLLVESDKVDSLKSPYLFLVGIDKVSKETCAGLIPLKAYERRAKERGML